MVLPGYSLQRLLAGAVLVILFSGSSLRVRAAEAGEVAGTMPEDYLPELKVILTNALRRSPELVAREFEQIASEARLTIARGARLPQLSGNFDYGITESATTSNTSSRSRTTGAQYNFGLGQALFHWGAIKNEIEIARINMLVVQKDTARVYRETSTLLRKAYLALIVEKARVIQARETIKLVESDRDVARTKKQGGTISGAALAGEEIRLNEARLGLERAENNFRTNRRRFGRVAGLAGGEIPEQEIPDEIRRPAFPELLATAIVAETLRDNAKGTIEYAIHDLRLQEAIRRQKIVATRLLPKFGASASYGLSTNTYVNGSVVNQEAVTQQRIGVGGSWTIFDGLATRGAKREALAGKRAAEYRKTVEIEKLLEDLQAFQRSLKLDAEKLEFADIRQGTAHEGRNLVEQGIARGSLPKIELDRANVNILAASAENLEARATYLGNWSEFVALAGRDPAQNNLPDRHGAK